MHNGLLTLSLPKSRIEKHDVLKLDFTMQEKAREARVKQRQHEEHIEETIHCRAEEELKNPHDAGISEEARLGMKKQTQHAENLKETMHSRTESEINTPL